MKVIWKNIKGRWVKMLPHAGDAIAATLKAAGFNTCSGCEKRRQLINKLGAKLAGKL